MILEQAGHYIDEARRLIRMELYKIEKHLMGESEYKPISRSLRDGVDFITIEEVEDSF